MELILSNAETFRKSIDAISVLIDEAELVVKSTGVELKATDPSQISMVDFSLPKSAFKKFSGEEMRLGLDLDYLSQVLSRAQSGDELSLDVDEKKSSLVVSFKGHAERSFKVPLIDISTNEVPNPRIEFDAEIKINSSLLQNSLKDAALISTHITLAADEKAFYVKANSSKGNLDEKLLPDKKEMIELKVKKECTSMFPLDYLQDMLKAAPSDSKVELFLKSNAPIKVSYPIGEASITYFLAPRIDNA